jgi:hypothetical protein
VKLRLGYLTLGMMLLGVVGCVPGSPPSEDAAWVVERFIAARQSGSLDATMDCFADQPEVRSSLGVAWSGRDAVRAIMAYRLADTYTVGNVHVGDNRVIWSEQVRRSVAGSPTAIFEEDVEAIVAGDRIARLVTYVGGAHPTPFEASTPPQLAVRTDLLAALGVVLLGAAAALGWTPAQPLPGSRGATGGHLLSGLRDYVARRG